MILALVLKQKNISKENFLKNKNWESIIKERETINHL
jgi:hypothetical protein